MIESARRRLLLATTPRGRRRRRARGHARLMLPPLLEAEARSCYEYGAAVRTGNQKWIDEAHERWLAARDAVQRLLDGTAA